MFHYLRCILKFCILPMSILFIVQTQGLAKSSLGVIMIPPFENISNVKSNTSYEKISSNGNGHQKYSYQIDRFSESARNILENMMVNMGMNIVERQRLDQLINENDLYSKSGLIDPRSAIEVGKILGTDFIFLGTIVNLRSIETNYSGYGVKFKGKEYLCSIRVRLINVNTGKNPFSKIIKGKSLFNDTQNMQINDSDPYFAAIEDALDNLFIDIDFMNEFSD